LVRLDRSIETVERLTLILSRDERERAARYRFKRDATRFLVGRAALRSILGEHLGIDPERVRLTCGAHGKPELAPRSTPPVFGSACRARRTSEYAP
jgi:4'-phosphopantetheinyl transferase